MDDLKETLTTWAESASDAFFEAKEAAWDVFFADALAAGHMAQPEVDVLSDALAEAGSTDERRDLLDELLPLLLELRALLKHHAAQQLLLEARHRHREVDHRHLRARGRRERARRGHEEGQRAAVRVSIG